MQPATSYQTTPKTPAMFAAGGALDAAEIACSAVFLALGVCNMAFVPRGCRRDNGWVRIAVFCAFKIVGSVLTLHIQHAHDASSSLRSASRIVNNIALSPLLAAASAFATTVATDLPNPHPLLQYLRRLLQLPLLAALILGVVAGTTTAAGSLLLASAALLMLAWTVLAAGTVVILYTQPANALVRAVALALPFLLVRVVCSLLAAARARLAGGNDTHGELGWALFMGSVMELGVVAVFTVTGVGMHRFQRGPREAGLEKEQAEAV
ncbi:hypothetical protein EDC01DRAFT_62684 [Geopyxis carbonaria]|nr:hypothetical protein EDC01DRAFT_62684 [Geopyxis carbonaria]